tara:strand:- start:1699 stop:2079 length:381 start_codon:yes stop_codon:yes gene_type:complete
MAEKIFFDVQALNPHVKMICGSFCPNGSSAVDNDSNTGTGFTVARGGTGSFTVTLDAKYPGLLSGQCSLALNAVADSKVQFGAIDVASAKTVVINVITTASAADIAANANNRIHFCLFLRNTSLTK